MKKINDKDLLLIVGGASTLSGTILNQLNKLISILVDSGKSLGSSIRRISEDKICPLD
ncbi:MAG: hypothetical protein LKJ84_01085 [Bacilli bacterium]|jgi:hypothetical protein|nr:hypothetical protein [Bacilli bacterium]